MLGAGAAGVAVAKLLFEAGVEDVIVCDRKGMLSIDRSDLKDEKLIAKDVANVGHWGNGDYQIQVEDDKDLEYIMSLVKQAIQ